METVLLIDFGSTYTKVTAVDVGGKALLGSAASRTTVETDVGEGLQNALRELEKATGKLEFSARFACSSAAGGLKMAVSGLVPELTAKAARLASLGAGAKVVKVFSHHLNDEDIEEISRINPDIFLLTGGTDGGNHECILHNAEMLSGCESKFPVIIAGNRSAASKCEELLQGREVCRCPNVMPSLNELNIVPTQEKIREIFLSRIIRAKGLSRESGLVSGILMPTPSAMLKAMELLSKGTETQSGIGELVAVDLGGATTDVYSIASGAPQNDNTVIKGLPEPYAKRTVEGDIGMRYGAGGILQATGAGILANLSGISAEKVVAMIENLAEHPDVLPCTPEQNALDYALACAAVEIAMTRHAGTVEEVYTPMGRIYSQTGKDLTRVERLVVTGGAIIHNSRAAGIAERVRQSPQNPGSLKPKDVSVYIDKKYILAAMGLLCGHYPDTAVTIMKKELEVHGAN